ncbi:MAG: hypothetical protein LBD67_06180 [Candidatus Accumulibacter sp.]|jgi:hypothetical protein|nr:hypothetical protein [Accumulibacter sp.]
MHTAPVRFLSDFACQTMLIGEGDPDCLLGNDASSSCLHYCAPTHGGWGVIRTALLVPEMYMLFVCPEACGRHGAIAAYEHGGKDRVGYLCLEEDEIAMGRYEQGIREAVPGLFKSLKRRPRAFLIVVSCIDDLMGTDYDEMISGFEAEFGIPFRIGHMNPISLDGKLPPGKRIQRDMYDFIEAPEGRDDSVCLVGAFQPIAKEAEIRELLRANGMYSLLHISECASFDEYQRLGRARLNLVVRPEGMDAAKNLREKFGTPFLFAPVAFSESTIAKRYDEISRFFGANMANNMANDAVNSRRQAEKRVLEAAGGKTIAIDNTATCSPFDLARALIEAGFNVSEIFTQKFPVFDRPSYGWLAENAPGIRVTSPIHHSNSWLRPDTPTADIAIGFTAAYLTNAPCVVPVAFDEGMYGHHGMVMLLDSLELALQGRIPGSLEQMVRDYGLVV